MDGDDDLFAVFDADENAETKPSPSSASADRQVIMVTFLSWYSATILMSDGRGKFSGWNLWDEKTILSKRWGGEGGGGGDEEVEEGGGAAGDDRAERRADQGEDGGVGGGAQGWGLGAGQ